MLVLSRKIDENVVIGDQIVVTVVSIRGRRVHLGITAPTDTPIRREKAERRGAPTERVPIVPSR
jgi:carbon storage regulator